MKKQIEKFDGELKIIYSSIFNIYNNQLKINSIGNYKIIFKFVKNPTNKYIFTIDGDNKKKEIIIHLNNFDNSIGTATTKPINILHDNDTQKNIYFSIFARILNKETDFRQVGVTFYEDLL